MTENTIQIPQINKILSNALEDLDLNYGIINNDDPHEYFVLNFEKPMPTGNKIEYTVLLLSDNETQNITILVPGIVRFHKANLNKEIFLKLNVLNATTVYGTIFFLEQSDEKIVINFSHSFPIVEEYDVILENLDAIFDYLDYFILEVKNILSDGVRI